MVPHFLDLYNVVEKKLLGSHSDIFIGQKHSCLAIMKSITTLHVPSRGGYLNKQHNNTNLNKRRHLPPSPVF